MRYGWSLSKSAWAMLPLDARDGSRWRRVVLHQADEIRVPTNSGVYVVCARPPVAGPPAKITSKDLWHKLYGALYVGRSTNLRRRFGEHCRTPKPEIMRCQELWGVELHFWYLILDTALIETVESALIACLGPIANVVSGIKVRLVPPIPA